MTSARPLSASLAVVLMLVIDAGAVLFGAFWLAVAAGAVPILAPAGGLLGPAGLLGLASVGFGVAGLVGAIGLWFGRAWGWMVSFAVTSVALIGAVIAVSTAGPQVPVVAGFALTAAGAVTLIAPRTRSAVGIS